MTRPPRRVTLLVLFCALLGVGVTLVLRAALGSDGYSTLINGLHLATGVPFAVVNIGVALLLIALGWWKGARPGPGTIVQPVVTGVVVDLGLRVVDEPGTTVGRATMLTAGFCVVAVGVAGYLFTDSGAGPAETLAVAWDPPVPFRWSYSAFQGLTAVAGWLLGAAIGVGTLLLVLALGPTVDLVERRLRRSPLLP